jgi:hypothetical protein
MTTPSVPCLDGGNWREFVGLPDYQWPPDAIEARIAEQVLGRPIPNTRALTTADVELAKLRIWSAREGRAIVAGSA